MKNKLLLSLIVSLFAVSAWAADVSVVERFSQINQTSAVASDSWPGDVCNWSTSYTRHQQPNYSDANYSDYITIGTTNMVSTWMSYASSDKQGVFQTTDLEGGIKAVAFRWAQFGAEAGNTLNLEVKAGSKVDDYQSNTLLTRDGEGGENKTAGGVEYSHDFENKSNCQLSITNKSVKGGSKACRILIGDITITPYLLYTQKKAVVGLTQTGYKNLSLIDNTGEEGSITYSIHDKDAETQNVAEIDGNGVITPKAVGKAIVTATWSAGATTSYELTVANTVVETFSGVSQSGTSGASGSNWTGDICRWANKHARRKNTDLINSAQATWLTLDGSVRGFLQTTNLEGGLVGVSFDYAQFGAEAGTVLIWKTSDGTTANWVVRDGDLNKNPNSPNNYSYVFDNKQNAQLEILNASVLDNGTQPTGNARLLIGDITIAPYLLYTTKAAQLDMRNGASEYKNEDLVDNTALEPETDVVYSISPNDAGASINNSTGLVTAEDGTQGDFTVTATWGDVTTSYVLTIISRSEITASFENTIIPLTLGDENPTNTLTYTTEYDSDEGHSITYSSSNEEVASVVAATGAITLNGGVGQAKITASFAQSANYKAAEVFYYIQVTNNDANARIERFSNINGVTVSNALANPVWNGDLFQWHVFNSVRRNNDKFPSDNTDSHTGTWMGIPDPSTNYGILQSEEAVEGGIKYLWCYWEQWGSESEHILNPVIYIKTGDSEPVKKASVEYMPTGSPVAVNRMLIGINDVRSNSQLIIKNESHKSDDTRVANQGRIILDEIHITPWLLYTNKKCTLDTRNNVYTYTNETLIDNRGEETGDVVYSISPTEQGVTINGEGLVTAESGAQGNFTVTATWGNVSTSYILTVISRSETSASYTNAKVQLNKGAELTLNALNIMTDGYEAELAEESKEIEYSSSNTEVANVTNTGVVSLAGGVGQAIITATLPQTASFKSTTAKYTIYVIDNSARKEAFGGLGSVGPLSDADFHNWTGDLFIWQRQYQVRHNSDNVKGVSGESHVGVSIGIQDPIGTPKSSTLRTKGNVEGGIKYLSFYMGQIGAHYNATRRLAVYAGDDLIGYGEIPQGKQYDEILVGINNAMPSNAQLIIKNESYLGDTYETRTSLSTSENCSRIVLDDIYITPYLLYTEKSHVLDTRSNTSTMTYTNENLINNTGTDPTYSIAANELGATIDSSNGQVTVLGNDKYGTVRVTATWGNVSTWYDLEIHGYQDAGLAFTNSVVKVRVNAPAVSNPFSKATDATVTFSSDNVAVAEVAENSGFVTIKGQGTATISAHADATDTYKEGNVSYTLHIMPTNWYMETFDNLSKMCIVAPGANTCSEEPVTDELNENIEWTYWLGGGNTAVFGNNAMYLRARKSSETCDYGYLKSETISGGLSSLSFLWNQGGVETDITNYNIVVKVNGNKVGEITAEAKDAKYSTPQEFSVNGLTYTGDVIIEIINETEYSGTDNRGRFVIDNLEWIGYVASTPSISLDANADNSVVLADKDGETVDVTISNRSLAANVWNTLCLPFAINKSTDLGGAQVVEMASAALNNDVLEIVFNDLSADELTAGKPYLVKPTSEINLTGFTDKTITATPLETDEGIIKFVGIYNPTELQGGDKSTLFVGAPNSAGDNLYYPSTTASLKGFRAYFKLNLPGGSNNAPKRARFVVNQTNVTTDMESVQPSAISSQKVLRDGQLFILRDGKTYNAMGQIIK